MQPRIGDPVYVLTKRGVMPATLSAWYVAPGGAEVADVRTEKGTVYTVQQVNVLDVDAGRIMLLHKRAEQLAANGYSVALCASGPCATLSEFLATGRLRVFPPHKHGSCGGWPVRLLPGGKLSCGCPVYQSGGVCKHVLGAPGLLHRKAAQAEQSGLHTHAATYRALAAMLVAAEPPPAPLSRPATPESHAQRHARLQQSATVDFP